MPVILGGPTARRVWTRGEFGLSLQYVNGEESLCIWPLRKSLGAGAMVIGISSAYLYADSRSGGPTEHMVERCIGGLMVMKMQPTRFTIKKLADIILDELPELIKMKPEPDELQQRMPEAEVDIKGSHMKVVLH